MVNNDTPLLRFKFMSIMNNEKSEIHKVYAYNDSDMKLFLSQHSFSHYEQCIDYGVFNNDSHLFENIIQPFHFKSNKFKDDATVMTTPNFVNEAVVWVGSELSASLIFGEPAIRGEIEVFKMISELIDKLPHVLILDQQIADESSLDYYDPDKWYDDGLDDNLIFESLLCTSATDQIQPITLESYVEYFTAILLK